VLSLAIVGSRAVTMTIWLLHSLSVGRKLAVRHGGLTE
jgi:hypothetical protein